MKQVLSRKKRTLLIGITAFTTILISICIAMSFASSFLMVQNNGIRYSYFISPVERNHTAFEDSEVFQNIFFDEMNDLTRFCVIKNQLETDGAYNGKKVIDITTYANRANVMIDESVTAEFYLDDLIKWGNYGFDYHTVTGTKEELNQYFSKHKAEDTSMFTNQNSGNSQVDSSDENQMVTLNLLVSRYKSVEGKELIEYADNTEEYLELLDNLQVASENLFQNYTEYVKFNKIYAPKKTNLVYCYQMITNGKVMRYTNLNQDVSNKTVDSITKDFNSYGQFLYYNPDKMQINTNVEGINAQMMKESLSSYEYAFGDNSRIWIGVNSKYPSDDALSKAKTAYEQDDFIFDLSILAGLVLLCILIYCIVSLIKTEGYKKNSNNEIEIRLRKIDFVYLEFYLPVVVGLLLLYIMAFSKIVSYLLENGFQLFMSSVLFGISGLILSIVFLPLFLSFIRKCRKKILFKQSLLYKMIMRIKKEFWESYDHGQTASRTWLPYLLFLCSNLVLVLIGVFGILIAFIMDMGIGIYLYHENKARERIEKGIDAIKEGDFSYKIDIKNLHGENLILANSINNIGESIKAAVETSMKDERLKADLITNVSHDIKTPLTSIINYVDLIKRENITDEKIQGYIKVLDTKSQRLKQLTDDLVEASKITSGNISLQFEKINFVELIYQSLGEFSEKFEEKELTIVTNMPETPAYILADSRRIYRVIENLFNNIYKYAMEQTRVYVDMGIDEEHSHVILSVKNISKQALNIRADDLTERFIRGDVSRGTEGSGLGLSIAKNLTQAQKGIFEIILDGDLFKVVLTFSVQQ